MSVTSIPADDEADALALRVAAELAETTSRIPHRERLLAASARASRLLLEASDVMAAMPKVLRELGEAAEVDRTAFAIAETDEHGARWLIIKSEWTADYVIGERSSTVRMAFGDRTSDCYCTQLRTGRSVYVCHTESDDRRASIASELAKSSMIVPFLVDGEYAGAIGFDDCRRTREFDPAVVSALEIAASVIGAALHREKLVEAVRHERELANEQRVAELAKANVVLRSNLERLASAPDPYTFLGHMLLEVTRHLDAVAGTIVMLTGSGDEWRIMANVRNGVLEAPPFPITMPNSADFQEDLKCISREPRYYLIGQANNSRWPGLAEYHRREGHQSLYKSPLVFGDHIVGFVSLAFHHTNPLSSEDAELLIALVQQATLAVGLKRLAVSAKNAAVLAERNRIGQEIHDGLAQAFTGILMQLGAAEELAEGSPLAVVMTRIRDIAREGLSEARRSVLALRPSEQRPGGLGLALQQLAERSTVDGRVASIFEGTVAATGLAPEHEHALLRIAQEAVSNAARHAQPHTIRIVLSTETEQLVMSVTDDGCGMEHLSELYAQQGFGLTNMRERAQAIGGEWKIDSRPSEGTRISVRIPRPLSHRT